MAINLTKPKPIEVFSNKHIALFPLAQPEKKYPKELAVFQNIFWKLTHEKHLKDDLLKLLFFFSPKIRQVKNDLLSERSVFQITAKEYAELTGIKLNTAYVALKRSVDMLYEHSVRFYHEESQQIIRTRLISSCGYADGIFTVSFTHYALYIMSVFNKDNPFTQLKVKSVMPLSSYALKIYPLFIQNEFRKTFEVSIAELKTALNIEIDSYPDFKEFKKAVLKPSIDAINTKTELSVSYKAIKKEGRRASHIEFSIEQGTKTTSVKSVPIHKGKELDSDQKIGWKKIFNTISENNLIDRFKESDESTEDFINRVKFDVNNDMTTYWVNKLKDFNITF